MNNIYFYSEVFSILSFLIKLDLAEKFKTQYSRIQALNIVNITTQYICAYFFNIINWMDLGKLDLQ